MDRAVATAPASIGNVGVGFDIVGQAFDVLRDRVTAVREDRPGVRLGAVSGLVDSLPDRVGDNTALAAAAAVLEAADAPFGVRLSIEKNIPLSAGMGGSAASAVAAAMAVNALLQHPYADEDLFPFALEGERAASESPPWDNVMASLLGGLVLAARSEPPLFVQIPTPPDIVAILLHPAARTETRKARALLREQVPMPLLVEHSRRLAAFTMGCATNDIDLIRAGLDDVVVEPQREHLLPALPAVKQAALAAGALGCSFSGSGPSIFAWAADRDADAVEVAMSWSLMDAGIAARVYRAPLQSAGACVVRIPEVVG